MFAQDRSPDFSAFDQIVYNFFHTGSSIKVQGMQHAYFRFVSGLHILMALVVYHQLQRLKGKTKPKLKERTACPEHFLSFVFLMKANVDSF